MKTLKLNIRRVVANKEYKIVRRVSSLHYDIFETLLQVIFRVWFINVQEISHIFILDGDDLIHSGIK